MAKKEGRTFELPFFDPRTGAGPVTEHIVNDIVFMGFEISKGSGTVLLIAGVKSGDVRENDAGRKVVRVRTVVDSSARASITRILERRFPGIQIEFFD